MAHARSRLTVEEFGWALMETGDLDPIYVMVNAGIEPWDVRARWCLAQWLFYHPGVSSQCAETDDSEDYWTQVMAFASMRNAPRGDARRHFRGELAIRSTRELRDRFPNPLDAVRYAAGRERPLPYRVGAGRVMGWRGFGTWAAYKVLDLLDACLEIPVDFSDTYDDLFVEPLLGAGVVAREWGVLDGEDLTRPLLLGAARRVMPELEARLAGCFVPHAPTRRPRFQEVETVLCKYKAYRQNTYHVGKDIEDIGELLENWGPLAERLRHALPTRPK